MFPFDITCNLTSERMHATPLFWLRWCGVVFVSLVVLALVSLPPFIPPEWRFFITASFSSLCHQLPHRSFHVDEVAFAVCHRCYGVYLGLPIAACVWPFLDPHRIRKKIMELWLFASIIIMAIDWAGPVVGWWENTLYSRLATGLLFGLTAAYFLVRALYPNVDPGSDATIDIPERNFV